MVGLVNQAQDQQKVIGVAPDSGTTVQPPPLAIDNAIDMGWDGTGGNEDQDVIELPPGGTYTGDPDDFNPPTTGNPNDPPAIPLPKPTDPPDPKDPPNIHPPAPDDPTNNTGIPPGGTDIGIPNTNPNLTGNPNEGADPGAGAGTDDRFGTVTGQADMLNQGLLALLNQGNPLFQQAALAGRRAANARGLGSSSFSERASQGAIYDIALPMAQQASSQAQAYEQLTRQQNFASTQAQLDRSLRQLEQEREIEYRTWLQNTTNEHQTLLQSSELAQQSYSQFMEAAMTILNNPETSKEQKDAAMAALQQALDNSLTLLQGTSGMDLSAFLPGGGGNTGGTWRPGTGPGAGPGPGDGPGGGGGYTNDPQYQQQLNQFMSDWQNQLRNTGLPNGMRVGDLGTLNGQGGLEDTAGWNFSDVLGNTAVDTISGIGNWVMDSFTDNFIVDYLSEQFPDIFEQDSMWSQIAGLGINIAATPVNVLVNLLGGVMDFFMGEEGDESTLEDVADPNAGTNQGTGVGGTGSSGGGYSDFGGMGSLPGNSYNDYVADTMGQYITYQQWLQGRNRTG